MNGNAPRRMADVRLGKDACFDAWLYNLFIDNNLVHDLNPHIVASPEQLKFMVAGGPGSVYLPCSDALFALLCEPTMPRRLQKEYNRAWRIRRYAAQTGRKIMKNFLKRCFKRVDKRMSPNQGFAVKRKFKNRLSGTAFGRGL